MKALILAMALTLTSAAAGAQKPDGVIEGRVLRLASSEPIPRIQVVIAKFASNLPDTPEAQEEATFLSFLIQQFISRPIRTNSDIDLDPRNSLGGRERSAGLPAGSLTNEYQAQTFSDDAGNFTFKDLAPGQYGILVHDNNYYAPVSLSTGSASTFVHAYTKVEAGKTTLPVVIRLVRGGAISGVVRDPSGTPIPKVSVATYREMISAFDGKVVSLFKVTQTTNDRGEYRLFDIPPGRYFVGAAASRPTDNNSWATTFYPGETEISKFTPIVIKEDAAEIRNIDFTLRKTDTRTFTLSGTAINPLPQVRTDPRTGVADRSVDGFFLVPHVPDPIDGIGALGLQRPNAMPANARPNGEFEIRNVKPGVYDLYAWFPYDGYRKHFASDKVTINVQSDVTGIHLAIRPGARLSAEVVIEGSNSEPIGLDSLKFDVARPVDRSPIAFTVTVRDLPFDKSGKLTVDDVAEGRYVSTVYPLPPSWYLADIRQGNTSVFETGFTVGPQAPPVRFVVNTTGNSISGTVQNSEGKPVSAANVILAPPPASRWNILRWQKQDSNRSGKFSFQGVRPGEYTLFAFDNPPPTNPWLSPEFLAQYENRGVKVHVEAGVAVEQQMLISIPSENPFTN